MTHQTFATTTRGLQRSSAPMRLFEKAKRFGVWNPAEIDFRQDRQDWLGFSPEQQDLILRLTSLFQAGEEAVTLDLLPLIQVIAAEGRIEEELYLTTFLWEEAKHTDFFSRFLEEVAGAPGDLSHFAGENYRAVVYEALPQALQRLRSDPSPAAQVQASVTYNLIVEGVLAETGYHAYYTILERNHLMPGVRHGINLLKQDESRHIAYGVYLLSRLLAEYPEVWGNLESQMNLLLAPAVGVISDIFSAYEIMPFDVREEDFIDYAMDQFSKRFARIERARHASLQEVEDDANQSIEAGE